MDRCTANRQQLNHSFPTTCIENTGPVIRGRRSQDHGSVKTPIKKYHNGSYFGKAILHVRLLAGVPEPKLS